MTHKLKDARLSHIKKLMKQRSVVYAFLKCIIVISVIVVDTRLFDFISFRISARNFYYFSPLSGPAASERIRLGVTFRYSGR